MKLSLAQIRTAHSSFFRSCLRNDSKHVQRRRSDFGRSGHVTEKSKFMRSGQGMTNQQNPKFQELVAKLRQIEQEFLQPMFSVEEV